MKIFSFDAETNGLHGQAFAIGAVVYENGKEVEAFVARCPIRENVNSWVVENVLPHMSDIEITHDSYESMLEAFAKFYLVNKNDADIIVHMGVPVESKVLVDMHKFGFIGDWAMPYPLIDIAGNLKQAGFDPTSVDSYNAGHGIKIEGNTHNPLCDSRAVAKCYISLVGGVK